MNHNIYMCPDYSDYATHKIDLQMTQCPVSAKITLTTKRLLNSWLSADVSPAHCCTRTFLVSPQNHSHNQRICFTIV